MFAHLKTDRRKKGIAQSVISPYRGLNKNDYCNIKNSKFHRLLEDRNVKALLTLSMSNCTGCGQRLGPDQNGAPELVTWSGGKLYSSCLIWLQKLSSKRCRAHDTQSAKFFGRPSTRMLFTASMLSICNARQITSNSTVWHKIR